VDRQECLSYHAGLGPFLLDMGLAFLKADDMVSHMPDSKGVRTTMLQVARIAICLLLPPIVAWLLTFGFFYMVWLNWDK